MNYLGKRRMRGKPSPIPFQPPAQYKRIGGARSRHPDDAARTGLAQTNHKVFAAPYHRNNDGNLALLKLMLARPSVAQQMLSDGHIGYVVVCETDSNRNIIARAPDGLEARLAQGEAPDSLERVDVASAGKIVTWRVRK